MAANKRDLVDTLQVALQKEELQVSKKDVDLIINLFLDAVHQLAKEHKEVALSGFGKFTVVDRPAREARSPATGAKVQVPASKTMKFKPSKTLKQML